MALTENTTATSLSAELPGIVEKIEMDWPVLPSGKWNSSSVRKLSRQLHDLSIHSKAARATTRYELTDKIDDAINRIVNDKVPPEAGRIDHPCLGNPRTAWPYPFDAKRTTARACRPGRPPQSFLLSPIKVPWRPGSAPCGQERLICSPGGIGRITVTPLCLKTENWRLNMPEISVYSASIY